MSTHHRTYAIHSTHGLGYFAGCDKVSGQPTWEALPIDAMIFRSAKHARCTADVMTYPERLEIVNIVALALQIRPSNRVAKKAPARKPTAIAAPAAAKEDIR